MTNIDSSRYPIGKFTKPANISLNQVKQWILELEQFPLKLEMAVKSLDQTALSYRYREGGWSVKQLIHHCADSHMNSLVRFKLTLTEDKPTIKPYYEDRWAELPDSLSDDIASVMNLLKGIHQKLVLVLRNLSPEQLKRAYVHPEYNKVFTLDETIGLYAWHGQHHLAHINLALKNQF